MIYQMAHILELILPGRFKGLHVEIDQLLLQIVRILGLFESELICYFHLGMFLFMLNLAFSTQAASFVGSLFYHIIHGHMTSKQVLAASR